jgi:phage gpG-like protein
MAGVWSIEKQGFQEVMKTLEVVGSAPEDFAELHELFALDAEDWSHEHWPTEPTSGRGGALLRDTGRLWQSLGGNGEGSIREVDNRWARYGTDLWYAAIHNFGGTITPKKGKYLAVPLTERARKAGSPWDHPMALAHFLAPLKSGKGYLWLAAGRGEDRKNWKNEGVKEWRENATPEYALVTEVEMPERKFMPTPEDLAERLLIVAKDWMDVRARRAAGG